MFVWICNVLNDIKICEKNNAFLGKGKCIKIKRVIE